MSLETVTDFLISQPSLRSWKHRWIPKLSSQFSWFVDIWTLFGDGYIHQFL